MECTVKHVTNHKAILFKKSFLELAQCKLERFFKNIRIEGAEAMSKTK